MEFAPILGFSTNFGEKSGVSRNPAVFERNYMIWDKTGKSCGHAFPSDVTIRL